MPQSLQARCLNVVLGLITGLALVGRPLSAQRPDIPSVSIRIDDYAAVPLRQLARAQDDVTQWYAAIGVETVWAGAHRVSQMPTRPEVSLNPTDLTVIVLSPEMVDRMAPPRDVVGAAPGTTTERGRIAYVFYHRLRMIAMAGDDLLGVVMAHEIGHLLLPYGSHSDTGVMRSHWDVRDLWCHDVRQLGFTPYQAQQIRRRVSGGIRRTMSSVASLLP